MGSAFIFVLEAYLSILLELLSVTDKFVNRIAGKRTNIQVQGGRFSRFVPTETYYLT